MPRPALSILGLRIPAPTTGDMAVRTALSIWSWGMLVVVSVTGFALQVPLLAVTAPFDKNRKAAGRWARLVAVAVAKLNPLWDFRIHGEVPPHRPKKTVVVSNHVSNSDVFLISHLPWEMKYLAKRSVFAIPFVGWLIWLAGDVAVVRGEKSSARGAMAKMAEYVERGMPVFVFPEGTRSASGELLPFKDGAFRLAIEAGADILPLAVAGTRDALPKHSWRFGWSRGLVTVGQPISTAGMTLDDLERLKSDTRAAIEKLRAEIEPLTQ
jgi:1-acyl-sn-glycerol-3-phosphate acyltransferase